MNDTTERFLRDIAERIGHDRVTEVHLFPAVRQGGVEAGLAVVAAQPDPPGPSASELAETEPTEGSGSDSPSGAPPVAEANAPAEVALAGPPRHVVYTARYRHTLKGPDRGRWESDVVAEADAPLVTVDRVVRGVVRRAGEELEPERISGDQFRALVPAPGDPASAPA